MFQLLAVNFYNPAFSFFTPLTPSGRVFRRDFVISLTLQIKTSSSLTVTNRMRTAISFQAKLRQMVESWLTLLQVNENVTSNASVYFLLTLFSKRRVFLAKRC